MFKLTRVANALCSSQKKPVIPKIDEIKQYWGQFSKDYSQFDYCPQSLYYSFLYMLDLPKANNVLQVACGTGKLLSLAANLKSQQTSYLGLDLAPEMVQHSRMNLHNYLKRFQSRLDLETWMSKNKMQLMTGNAEEPIVRPQGHQGRFDRIICNCVLMITENPKKMLINLHNEAEKDCLLGVSVWGNKNENNFFSAIRQSYIEAGVELPDQRSNFHLYKKVAGLAEECGWETVLNWEQNAVFPALTLQSQTCKSFVYAQINKLQPAKREKVRVILQKKINKILLQQKKGLNFSCEMHILKKK